MTFYLFLGLFACLWLEVVSWFTQKRLLALIAAPLLVVACLLFYVLLIDSFIKGDPVDPLLVVGLMFAYACAALCTLAHESIRLLVLRIVRPQHADKETM